jgi:hypothetical protein
MVATSLAGRAFHSLRVVRASAEVDQDARGLDAVFINVELEPPPEGVETWPRQEVDELRRSVEAELADQGVTLPAHIRAFPSNEADEGQDDVERLDGGPDEEEAP